MVVRRSHERTQFENHIGGLALIVAGTVAVSQTIKRSHWEHDGMFGGPGLGFLAHRLDLTDEQRAQAKEILAKEKPTIQPLLSSSP